MTRTNCLPAWTRLARARRSIAARARSAYAQAPQPEPDDPPVRVGRMSFANGEVSLRAGRQRRMGAGAGQPPDRHRRPIVGRQQRARGTICRQQLVVARRADQRDGVESRRSHCAVPVAAGHARVPRAPAARRQHRRSRHAEPRVYRDAAGPVSRRRRSAGWRDDGQSCARAAPRSMAKARRMPSRAARRIVSTAPTCATASLHRCRRPMRSIASSPNAIGRYERDVSARYVSPEVVGYEDLDTYGTWSARGDVRQRLVPAQRCAPAGRRIAKATGRGSIRGAGRGSTTSRGASRRSTTAAGRTSIAAGAGCRVRERPPGLCAGARRVRRRIGIQHFRFVRPGDRLVSARAARRLSAAVSREPQLLPPGERQQHGRSTRSNITNVYNNYRTNTNVTQVNYVEHARAQRA